jgi:phthalate 4,5-dioxygenase
MLSKEDNDRITQTGPGTPMGNLFRQYWMPALLSTELPEPDCAPVRVLLLSERLIAFRDTKGQVGLVESTCPHRGASLFYARNEHCGLRCVYHGWKFDISGACVDIPNLPASEINFKDKVRLKSYPCRERNGVVWAYLGPQRPPPPLPDLEPNMMPDGKWYVRAYQVECNYLNIVEGDFDESHNSFLHYGSLDPESLPEGTFRYYMERDRGPKYAVVDTPGGLVYAAYRAAEPGHTYYRVNQFILPMVAMHAVGALGDWVQAWYSVPMDDTHTLRIIFGVRENGVPRDRNFDDSLFNYLPTTTDWYGRFRLRQGVMNDYEIDRGRQHRNEEFSGIHGLALQDQAIAESEGPIYDRTKEQLCYSDMGVIRVRRRLLAAAAALERGELPLGATDPTVYRVRGGGVVLPDATDWVEATKDLRQAFTTHRTAQDRGAHEIRAKNVFIKPRQ